MNQRELIGTLVQGVPRSWWRYLAKGLLLCLAVGLVIFLVHLDREALARLGTMPLWVIFLLIGMVTTAWCCNGARTFLLARAFGHRLKFRQAVAITLTMEFAIAATPGGFGGIPTRLLLQRRCGISVHQSLTMIAADLSADLLFFLLLAPIALISFLRFEPVINLLDQVSWNAGPFAIAVIVGGVLLLGLLRKPLIARLGKVRRLRFLLLRARREWRRLASTVKWLWHNGRAWYIAAFLFCSLQWSCRYGVLPVILWALGTPVDAMALVYLQGLLFVISLLVVMPGGGGAVELLSTLILQPVVGGSTAALAVLCWRIFTYYLYIIAGASAAMLHLRGSNRGQD